MPHTGFGAFPNPLGIEASNSTTSGSILPTFIRGCISGEPAMMCQARDYHTERL